MHVYRCYDGTGTLLYVGRSVNVIARISQHKSGARRNGMWPFRRKDDRELINELRWNIVKLLEREKILVEELAFQSATADSLRRELWAVVRGAGHPVLVAEEWLGEDVAHREVEVNRRSRTRTYRINRVNGR